jgi:ATP-binding cassette, subfamily B, multidrug efflux pump
MSADGTPMETQAERKQRVLAELQLEPEETPRHDLSLVRRLWPFLKPHALLLTLSILLIPLTTAASLYQPYLVKETVDAVLLSPTHRSWSQLVGLYAIAVLVQFVGFFGQTYLVQLAGQRSMVQLRRAVFDHALKLRVRFYDRTAVGRVQTRVTNDIDALGEAFSSGAVMAIADIVLILGVVGFMISIDLQLSLVAFATLPPLMLAIDLIRRGARRAFRDIRARIAQLNGYLAEQVQGVQVVQAFGREAACAEEYSFINDAHRNANLRAIRYDAAMYSVVEAVSVTAVALVLLYAVYRLGGLPEGTHAVTYVGTVVAFQQYIQLFFMPIRDFSTKYTIVQSSLAAAERVFGLLDQPEVEDADPPAPKTIARDQARTLAFEDVSFGYREGERVLHDLTFTMRPGETIAVVGPTGAGKSSIISLLLRLYDIDAGAIRVGDVDIRELRRHELRGLISVVPQDVFLFAGTVAVNIAQKHAPDLAKVEDVLRRVGALDAILSREGGLSARVEERGSNFSAGERQLLAFARALYRDAPLLVLDEATAHIDSETEARLEAAVRELVRGRTSLVIAHRLSTVRRANRILVLHKGRIVEQGTHEELIALGRMYARLYRLQLQQQES